MMQQNPGIGGGAPMLPPKPGMGVPNMNMNGMQPSGQQMRGGPNAGMGFNPNGNNPRKAPVIHNVLYIELPPKPQPAPQQPGNDPFATNPQQRQFYQNLFMQLV